MLEPPDLQKQDKSHRPPSDAIEQEVYQQFATGSGIEQAPWVHRGRAYAFVLDGDGMPIELGSGRFAKTFLGEEAWLESKTGYRRPIAIKALQRGVDEEARLRFQLEKQILESVQRHPNIVEVLASGETDNPLFVPPPLADRIDNDFVILELLETSLEERLKGAHRGRRRDDLLQLPPEERLIASLDYVLPVAAAVEFAHLVRNVCHRDIKPSNILLRLPNPELAGDQMEVRLTDFNSGHQSEPDMDLSLTRLESVPGTLFFQSPEQETGTLELLVNVEHGSHEVRFFEDFYMDIAENDRFSLFNRQEIYRVASADRSGKKLLLDRPWAEPSEVSVRAKVAKAVGRPADIYSLGALLYYLVSGAYGNPKSFYDSFRRFIEYDRDDDNNRVGAYIEHEYGKMHSLRAPKQEDDRSEIQPQDRFFTYKHYLDGNGEVIDKRIMLVIARAMIRNKPDSYCQSWDLRTQGITSLVRDLIALYPGTTTRSTRGRWRSEEKRSGGGLRRALDRVLHRRRLSSS